MDPKAVAEPKQPSEPSDIAGLDPCFYIFDERMCEYHKYEKGKTIVINKPPSSNQKDPQATSSPLLFSGNYNCPEIPSRTLNIYNHLTKEGLLQKM